VEIKAKKLVLQKTDESIFWQVAKARFRIHDAGDSNAEARDNWLARRLRQTDTLMWTINMLVISARDLQAYAVKYSHCASSVARALQCAEGAWRMKAIRHN
jgi:hypothetical protein